MFGYHVKLALLSLRQSPVLTGLMVALIALGVGISMTTLTIYYLMSGDPIPTKSDQLYNVRIDSWDPEEPADDHQPEQAPYQLTWIDAQAVRQLEGPERKAAMFKGVFSVVPEGEDAKPTVVVSRMTDGDFFEMFDVPFLYGGGWTPAADRDREPVVVLSREFNEEIYGGENSVGESLMFGDRYFRVVGVLDEWKPTPKFYDLNNGSYDDPEDVFMPFSLIEEGEMDRAGNTNCWGSDEINSWEQFLASKCIWIQFWIEAVNEEQLAAFRDNLEAYVIDQKRTGRLPRPMNNQIDPVMDWLDVNEVVGDDNKVLVGLSFLFLAVCLFNAIGLLLARFIGKAPMVGVRRALGASKLAIFRQHMVEVGLIGLVGGLVGLGLSKLGLMGVKELYRGYENLVHMDWTLVFIAMAIAVVSSLLAGLYPTWRVCQTPPATYLKTQ